MSKLLEQKVFRDPIHGYIRVDEEVVWKCIATKEFQRLRRIKQLGSTSVIYHTGEHSRFAHSLGVYEIVRRMVYEVKDLDACLSEYEKITVMLAGLLHDVGHAPFSHSFESIIDCEHEKYTVQIITQESEINTVLKEFNPNLPNDVASIINGNHENPILNQLVSSQLDADRMDYLLRDSYFTGTKYGEFDLERVIRTMRVAQNRLVVKESGMHTIEDYIMARYHMYWQVYYHGDSRSFDALLSNLFKRLLDLYRHDESILNKLPMFKDLLTKKVMSNEEYYLLDDSTCYYAFHLMEKMDDEILSDLAHRILNRGLFAAGRIDKYDEIKTKVEKAGYNTEYYLTVDHQTQKPYKPYSDSSKMSIWVLNSDGTISELSTVSNIVSAICAKNETHDELVFYPKELSK